jgi:choline dehydrogenase-like flavoprotein
MIADLSSLGANAEIDCDVCVVGSGAAGATLTHELIESGLKVCLLESGGLELEPEAQRLNEGVVVGHPMSLTASRSRGLGGTTALWTGRCAPLDAIDFEPRDWVPRSGWPFPRAALDAYYARAQTYCGFDAPWTEERAVVLGAPEVPLPAFDDETLKLFVWRYAPQGNRIYVDWGKRLRPAFSRTADLQVLLHATVTGFELSPDRSGIEAVLVRGPGGAAARVRARATALCCGGVGNAVLLLEGARATGAAFGNGGGLLGRCFQQHPRASIATVEADAKQSATLQKMFNIFATRRSIQYEIGWALSEEIQRAERLLNASVIAVYEADPASAWESAKTLVADARRGRISADAASRLGAVVRKAPDVLRNAFRRALDEHALLETSRIDLVIDVEQIPEPLSRITLAEQRDALGGPVPVVDWRLSEPERRTAARFAEILAAEFARLGLGRVVPAAWLADGRPLSDTPIKEVFHHIGATRMSDDPAQGVVDADAKVHDLANLYVSGASVFPTGGHANPTLSIVALAIRLADHLKTTLKR